MSFRRHITQILSETHRSVGNTIATTVLFILIVLNVVAVILESVDSFATQYALALFIFEILSVALFTCEYCARIWVLPDTVVTQDTPLWKARIRYMCRPLAVIDLLAILPFYLSLFIPLDLRLLRAVRLLRVLKMTRYSSAITAIFTVIRAESRALTVAIFLLMLLLLFTSTCIYFIEKDIQPDHFGSIPDAMWWAMATLTTVGYGDVTPITSLGKVFAGIITVLGVGMVALPTGILASGFADAIRPNKETTDIKKTDCPYCKRSFTIK